MKTFKWVCRICLILTVMLMISSPSSAAEVRLNFGTSSPGGIWYYIGGGLTSTWTRNIPNLNVVAEATGGDLENARRLGRGDVDISMNHSPTIKRAYDGVGQFKQPAKDIRLLCAIYDSARSIAALRSSNIKTLSDLAGKKIAVGPPGSGSGADAKTLFDSIGLGSKVELVYIGYEDGATALKEGQVQAVFQNGAPSANILSIEATHPINLLGLTKDEATMFMQKNKGYIIKDIPPKTYASIDYPVSIFWNVVFLDAHARVKDEVIYEITKNTFVELKKGSFDTVHVLMKQINPGIEAGKSLGVPFHPGAIKYYKEIGVWKD